MTLNLNYGTPADRENTWKKRRKRLYSIFEKYSQGIIATQEALPLQIEEIIKEVPNLGVVYRSRTAVQDEGPANAIFYNKEKWEVVENETFWFSDTPEIPASKGWGNSLPRTGNLTIFKDKVTGQQLKLVNIHLDHLSAESREKTIELILTKLVAEIDPIPTFVTGDFNVTPDNKIIERMEEFFKDSFQGDPLSGCTFHNYMGGSHCPRLDYIFYLDDFGVSLGNFTIDQWKQKGLYPQDHYPVVATFRLEKN